MRICTHKVVIVYPDDTQCLVMKTDNVAEACNTAIRLMKRVIAGEAISVVVAKIMEA